MSKTSLFLSRTEVAVVIGVGVATGLADHQTEAFVFALVAHVHSLVILNDYLAYKTGGPVFGDLLQNYLEWGGVLAACLVRKPGAGTVALTINGAIQVFLYGTHDPHLLYGVAGLGADVVFACFRYKKYDLLTVALAGAASAIFWYPIVWFTHGIYLYPATFIASDLALRMIGGAVGDGLLAGALAFILLGTAGQRWDETPVQAFAGGGYDALGRADGVAALLGALGVLVIVLTRAISPVSRFFLSIGPKIPSGNPLVEEYNPGYVIGVEMIFIPLALLVLWHIASSYWGE